MKNETEKLDRFKKAVFSDAQKQVDNITADAENIRNEQIKQAQYETESYVKTHLSEIDKNAQAAAVREISSKSLESKRNILCHREEIIDKVFSNVRKKLDAYKLTGAYSQLLYDRAKRCADSYPNERGKILISLSDRPLADKLSMGGIFTVEVSDSIEIGGIMIVFEERNLAFDYTFDYAFSTERESFAARAGLSL